MILIWELDKKYALIGKMIQVWKLYSWLIEEDAFILGVVFRLFLLESVVHVDTSGFRIAINFWSRSFFWVLIWRRLVTFLVMGLMEIAQARRLVVLMDIIFLVLIIALSAHVTLARIMSDCFESKFNYIWAQMIWPWIITRLIYMKRLLPPKNLTNR